MADLADNTAATTAGYKLAQVDRGAGAKGNRYVSRYEKWMAGATGEPGYLLKGDGESNVSQAAADAAALATLNVQRNDRAVKKSSQGGVHTIDIH